MRGADTFTESLFTMRRLDDFVPADHPLRPIRAMVNEALVKMDGLSMDDAVWVPSVFTKNRERLIAHDAIIELFNHIVKTADRKGWLSGEHFSVDGTLIQAWARRPARCATWATPSRTTAMA